MSIANESAPRDEAARKGVAITLPDGTVRSFDNPVTGADLASSIGPGLAKAALGVAIGDEIRDLSRLIDQDCAVRDCFS